MGTEITIALKRLSDIQTARLIVDESPPDPRAGGSAMTTILAWRRNHRMSDTEIYGTKQEFRENVLDRMEKNRTSPAPQAHEGLRARVARDGQGPHGRRQEQPRRDQAGPHARPRRHVLLNTEGPHDHWDSRHLG